MKVILSLLLQVGPIFLVLFWPGVRLKGLRQLLYGGVALAASGFATFIGSKYFGLSVGSRHGGSSHGEDAVRVSLDILEVGVSLIAIYYLLSQLVIPYWQSVRHGKNG